MIFQNFGFNQNYPVAAVTPAPSIQRLAVSSSLYAYYDVAFTASYSASAQTTIFDLSPNAKNGTVSTNWNYNTLDISGSVLRLATSANGNTIAMPQLTLSGAVTFVTAWYMTSASYVGDFVDLFGGIDNEYYGMFAGNNAGNSSRILPSINDVYDIPATTSGIPTGSASSGSWHISQFSFNDSTNVWNWCMDGITGSYTQAAAITTGTITPKFNFDIVTTPLNGRFLNSGSMMQVMALYTGSLTTQELLDNHNSIKGRYGLA